MNEYHEEKPSMSQQAYRHTGETCQRVTGLLRQVMTDIAIIFVKEYKAFCAKS